MKTLTAILFAVLLMAGTLPATAQHQHSQQKTGEQAQADTPSQGGIMQGGMMQDGMMQDGMMQSMMQSDMMGMMHQMHRQMMDQAMRNPLRHSAMLVHMLPTMKDPLGLSDEQVAHLEKAAGQFKQQQSALKHKASQAEAQLKDMLASDKPDPATVKSLLRETAKHRADMKALGLETANRMKGKLTGEQRAKLAEMTPMQMHHHMMTNMTMMEIIKGEASDATSVIAPEGPDMPGVIVPVMVEISLEDLPSTDLSGMSSKWWKALRKEHTRLLGSSDEQVKQRALQNIIFFANTYPDVDFTRTTPKLYKIYQRDENEQYRLMALSALAAIGNRNIMELLREDVSVETSESICKYTLSVLADYYNNHMRTNTTMKEMMQAMHGDIMPT